MCISSPLFTFQGEFIQTVKTERGLYGLTMAAIEQVAQQGLACVTHMSLGVHCKGLSRNCSRGGGSPPSWLSSPLKLSILHVHLHNLAAHIHVK